MTEYTAELVTDRHGDTLYYAVNRGDRLVGLVYATGAWHIFGERSGTAESVGAGVLAMREFFGD